MLVCLIYAADRAVHIQLGVVKHCGLFFASPQSLNTMKSTVKHFIVWVMYFLDSKISSLTFLCIAFDIYSISFFVSLFVFVDEPRSLSQLNGPLLAPGPLPPLTTPPTPPMDSPVPSVCPLLPTPTPPLIPPSSSSPGCSTSSTSSEQPGSGPPVSGAVGTSASSSPSNPETEEDKAKKLLYCSLCKVAVNSLSQLEAHNKGGFICEVWYTKTAAVLLHFAANSWQLNHVGVYMTSFFCWWSKIHCRGKLFPCTYSYDWILFCLLKPHSCCCWKQHLSHPVCQRNFTK